MNSADFARIVGMEKKSPYTVLWKIRPIMLLDDISISFSDKEKFIKIEKDSKKVKLTKLELDNLDRVCNTYPDTDNLKILDFQKNVCKLVELVKRK